VTIAQGFDAVFSWMADDLPLDLWCASASPLVSAVVGGAVIAGVALLFWPFLTRPASKPAPGERLSPYVKQRAQSKKDKWTARCAIGLTSVLAALYLSSYAALSGRTCLSHACGANLWLLRVWAGVLIVWVVMVAILASSRWLRRDGQHP
jgi:hypothetical protein